MCNNNNIINTARAPVTAAATPLHRSPEENPYICESLVNKITPKTMSVFILPRRTFLSCQNPAARQHHESVNC